MRNTILIICFTVFSAATFAQHEHHAASSDSKVVSQTAVTFKDAKLGTAYTQYILLKDALVTSNSDEAKKTVSDLVKALAAVKDADAALKAATKLAGTSTLSEQRLNFSALSDEMAKLVKDGKLSSGSLYLEYCPMANENTGAFWLSNEKEIKNPYFGSMMLKCGSVKETIQ
jgi:hypothetical protein